MNDRILRLVALFEEAEKDIFQGYSEQFYRIAFTDDKWRGSLLLNQLRKTWKN
jgi:hypothetical protein